MREGTKLLALTLAILAAAWLAESILHAWLFHEGRVLDELFPQSTHDWWNRAIYAGALLLLISYVLFVSVRRKQAQEAMGLRDRAIAASSNGIIISDPNQPDNPMVYVNPAFERITGYSADEAIGRNCRFLQGEDRDQPELIELRSAIEERRECSVILRNYKKDGTFFFNELHVSPVIDEGGKLDTFVGVLEDVTERMALEARLEDQAFHDTLTGLPNRVLLAERLERALAGSDRQGGKVAVLLVDLDDFKKVNDSLGHLAGDEVLAECARRLEGSVRPGDTVARFGGDEFAILLDGTDEQEAIDVAKRLIEELRREPYSIGGRQILAAPSVGIAVSGHTEQGLEDLIRRADLALHQAKERGKARHACFTPDLDARLRARLELEDELHGALEREEFRVFYQPKVSIGSGEIVGMEALVRWEHPGRGLLAPSEFLALAEDTGLIVPIGRWVLQTACHQAKEWQERYPNDPPLPISVNLSPTQFRRPNLVEEIETALRESEFDARALTLEITEEAAMEDAHVTAEALRKLKATGLSIEVDDFGKGYSSLSYLKRFPVDYLKVDSAFVTGLGRNPEDEGIVRAIVELAHTLGLKVVAEGVDNGEQLGLLREMGCELAQGSYFWAALPAEAIGELLAAYKE